MTKKQEPIYLDQTAEQLKTILSNMRANLKGQFANLNNNVRIIAEGAIERPYDDIAMIASTIRRHTVNENEKLFPVGDIITIPWSNQNDATLYQTQWVIAHHEEVELQNGSKVPGMYLQMLPPIGNKILFSEQTFFYFPNGLEMGKYCLLINNRVDLNLLGKTQPQQCLIDIAQSLGVGSCVKLNQMDKSTSQLNVTLIDSNSAEETNMIWVLTDSTSDIPSEYTILGESIGAIQNGLTTALYGNSQYYNSYVRQYLNAIGENWWRAQDTFDYNSGIYEYGFLSGFNYAFLSAIKPVKIQTKNGNEAITTYDSIFLPSLANINIDDGKTYNIEGPTFELWKRRTNSDEPLTKTQASGNAGWDFGCLINPNAKGNCLLRTAYDDKSVNIISTPAKQIGIQRAAIQEYFMPVCVVC